MRWKMTPLSFQSRQEATGRLASSATIIRLTLTVSGCSIRMINLS